MNNTTGSAREGCFVGYDGDDDRWTVFVIAAVTALFLVATVLASIGRSLRRRRIDASTNA